METVDIIRLILNAFELAAAIAGFVYWYKLKNTYWQWFPFLLAFIFVTEIAAKLIRMEGSYKTMVPLLYNYLNIPVMIIGFIWLMGQELKKTRKQYLPLILTGVYILSFIVEELFFKTNFKSFATLSYQIGSVGIFMLAILSFLNLIRSNEILNFTKSLHFWVSLGVLLYLITSLPFMAFRNSLFKDNQDLGTQLWYVTMFFNLLMYSCFIIGFRLYQPKIKKDFLINVHGKG